MKLNYKVLTISLLWGITSSCEQQCDIVFGTGLKNTVQMKESASLAKTAKLTVLETKDQGRDIRYSYYFKEAGEEMPFRVCSPEGWDGKSPLPLVMFLHGGWNDENSYLDQNDRQLIKLAGAHGYLLVSPLGCHASYGNRLILPAEFGRDEEATEILAKTTAEKMQEQELSEKDIINVLEIVLENYPIDRDNMFLTGHSMGSGGTWYLGNKYRVYWKALAMMSGPFALKDGYPWRRIKKMPIFISEGTLATASLRSSRELRDYAEIIGLNYTYKEVEGDHGGMVPMILPDVFTFFDRQRSKSSGRFR